MGFSHSFSSSLGEKAEEERLRAVQQSRLGGIPTPVLKSSPFEVV